MMKKGFENTHYVGDGLSSLWLIILLITQLSAPKKKEMSKDDKSNWLFY